MSAASMTKAARGVLLFFLFSPFCPALHANPQAPQAQTAAPPENQAAGAGGSARTAGPPSAAVPQKRITSYTLPPDLYRKARNRGRIEFAARVLGFFYGLAVLWFILRSKLSAKFRDWAEKRSRKRFVQAFLFTPALVLTIGVLQLPLDIFDECIAKLYKISVQHWPSWFGDWGKGQLLAIGVGGLLVWILYAVIRKSPKRWWLYFWMISLPLTMFGAFITPYMIDPLFNKYEPLEAKAPLLVPQLERVSRRAGQEISPARMFWMNASDKTVSTNASVNGFGASKRIIIWDTTLAQETTDEVLTDFGHELGHYVLGHIWKGFVFGATMFFVLLYCGFRTIGWLLARYGAAWGIRGLDDWASLPALLFLITLFAVAAGVLGNSFSRYQENQADIYGLEVTHGIVPDSGQAFAHSFQVYGENVLVDPDPNPIDVFLFYDHPTVRDRIHLAATYDPWSHGRTPQFVK